MASPGQSQLPGLPGFDPDNLQPWIVEVVSAVTALSVVSVGLRLVSRHIMGQKLWWDDWMIIFSQVCFRCHAQSPWDVLQPTPDD